MTDALEVINLHDNYQTHLNSVTSNNSQWSKNKIVLHCSAVLSIIHVSILHLFFFVIIYNF